MTTPSAHGRDSLTDALNRGFALPAGDARRRDWLTPVALFVLLALAAVLVARLIVHALYPYPIDSGEGCILGSAWHAACGQPVYQAIDKPPFFFTIYSPIYIYLGGLSMHIFGPSATAMRIIASLALAGIAFLVYLFVRRETGSASAGLVAALFLLVERHFFSRAGYAVTDCPALFFSVLGLYLWRSGGASRHAALVAFALAFFTKQNSLIAAAAAFASLFLEGKRLKSVALFGIFCALIGAGLGLCYLLFGEAYFTNTITYPSIAPFAAGDAVKRVAEAVGLCIAPFFVWISFLARSRKEKRLLLPALYALFGLLFAFANGRVGASRSYMFDLVTGLAIALGMAWPAIALRARISRLVSPVTAIAAAQIALVITGLVYGMWRIGDPTPAGRLHDAAIREAYCEYSGMVFSREQGYNVGARAENVSVDVFKLKQLIDAGALSRNVILDPIRSHGFAMIIMKPRAEDDIIFTGYLREAVLEYYTVKYAKYGEWFMVPKEDAAS